MPSRRLDCRAHGNGKDKHAANTQPIGKGKADDCKDKRRTGTAHGKGEAGDGGSTRRGVVLDAVALQHYMKDLMQGLFGDMLVWKIFHGHTSDVQQLLFNFNLEVSSPIFDTATVAQELEQLARRNGEQFRLLLLRGACR